MTPEGFCKIAADEGMKDYMADIALQALEDRRGTEKVSETISVKRKDLEEWREFVEEFGCDGCMSVKKDCRGCGVPMVKRKMTRYLKKEDEK